MNHNQSVLVVVSHPDDEVLGVGATISRYARNGTPVHILILGEGITSRQDARDPGLVQEELIRLHSDAQRAAGCLGPRVSVEVRDFPDNRFDTVPLLDVVKCVESVKAAMKPTVVFTHHASDLNIDHRVTADAVFTAFRPLQGETVTEIYAFETLSSTEWQRPGALTAFCPSFYVAISEEDLRHKIEAMESYTLERRPAPHPRAPETLEALARLRGSTIGAPFAEAFETVRRILR